MNEIQKAKEFAIKAHQDQRRKYTDDPYWYHLRNVVEILRASFKDCTLPTDYFFSNYMEKVYQIAWLHDVIEDTKITRMEITTNFDNFVADGVLWLSDTTPLSAGNRKYRKERYAKQINCAPTHIQLIKYADLIDNLFSIVNYDPNFARIYVAEKRYLLNLMDKAKFCSLAKTADILCSRCEAELGLI